MEFTYQFWCFGALKKLYFEKNPQKYTNCIKKQLHDNTKYGKMNLYVQGRAPGRMFFGQKITEE